MTFENFFSPSSVAIIGASHTKGKIGYSVAENFVRESYKGQVYAVNPDTTPILGLPTYKSVLDIPDKIDLGIIVVPAVIVSKVLKECVKKKIPSLIIISGGFSETGENGKKLEEELKKILKNSKTRVIGPNCVGIYDSTTKVDTLFLSIDRLKRPKEGNIAFISQSGAVGSTILDWLAVEGVGISKFISYGNAVDVNEAQLLDFLAKDEKTKVIAVYLEGIKSDGKEFMKIAKEVSKKKPIVVLKAGKTAKGGQAVASHTGSLAGSERIFAAVFKQTGIIEAQNWEELIDFAKAFSMQPLPKGDKLAIITDGGGFGVLATDEAERQNLELPEPGKALVKSLKTKLPPYVILHNPLDITGDATTERYRIVLEEILKKEFDGVIVIALMQVPTLDNKIIDTIVSMKKFGKPILCSMIGSEFTERAEKMLENNGIPVYQTPERAVRTFSSLVYYANKKKEIM
jgi:acetyl coenzyme A synthetase (ADP forming)-like protein